MMHRRARVFLACAALVAGGAAARADQTLWDVLRAGGIPHPAQTAAQGQHPQQQATPQPTTMQQPTMVQQPMQPGHIGSGVFAQQVPIATGPGQMSRSINALPDPNLSPFANSGQIRTNRPDSPPTPKPAKAADSRTADVAAISAIAATPGAPPRLWDMLRAGSQANELGAALFPTRPDAGKRVIGPDGSPVDDQTKTKHRTPRSGIAGMIDRVGDTFDRVAKLTRTEIKATGSHTMGIHMENVSGNRDAYSSSTYYGRSMMGGGYANTNMDVRGKVLGIFNFETHYSNNLYGAPYENRVSLNYATKEFKLDAGDIQGGIHGNSLLDFSRSLKGIQLSINPMKGLTLTTLYSQTKAETRTVTINGANRSGPYYVYAGHVVDGSVKVRVNNKDMVLDQDYTLDPYTGELNFKNGLVVLETDTIAITFEAYGYNQSAGMLTGYRADVGMIKGVKLGASYMSQTGSNSSGTTPSKTEQFYGYNNASTPYLLDYSVDMIVTKDNAGNITSALPRYPMTVTVGSVNQIYGVDYVVDPTLPNRVFFKLAIPSTQIIRITYVPSISSDTIGDRNVMGFDAGFALGKKHNITAEMATSRYLQGSSSVQGAAWQVKGDSRFLAGDALNWTWSLRDINPNFTAIESPGFRRNEAGYSSTLDYRPTKSIKLSASMENTERAAYSYSSSTSTSSLTDATGRDHFNQLNLSANWSMGKGSQLTLNHNDMRTRLSAGGFTSYGTDALTLSSSWKALSGDISLQRSNNSSTSVTSGTGSTSTNTSGYNSDSLTSRLNLQYRASDRLQLQTGVSLIDMKGSSTGSNKATDISLSADYSPLHNLKLRANFQLQDSGSNTLASGTTSTTTTSSALAANAVFASSAAISRDTTYSGGINNGLGGFGNYSGGFGYGGSNYSTANYTGKSRSIGFQTSYQPIQPLTLEMVWNSSTSLGDYLYNSTRNDFTFNVGYALGERMTFNTALSVQQVAYSGQAGGTSSNILFLSFRGKPLGKLGTTLNYQMMRSTNATTTGSSGTSSTGSIYGSGGTNLNSILLRLEYPLWRGNNLYFQFDNSDSTGYLASSQRTLSMGIAFDLNRGMQFSLGWRDQEFLSRDTSSTSSTSTNYNYRVGSLDADLNMHF